MAEQISPADTIRIAVCNGNSKTTAVEPREITFKDLADMLSDPEIGDKDGKYYLRGGDMSKLLRGNEHLKSADLLIIDGDSGFDPATGEITSAPPMGAVTAVLKKLGLRYAAHTTHSYVPGVKWKYRIAIPARLKHEADLKACVGWVMSQLHAAGVYLTDVKENSTWAQAWFMPRVPDAEAQKAFRSDVNLEGKPLNVSDCVAWWVMNEDDTAEQEIMASEPEHPSIGNVLGLGPVDGQSIIEQFNSDHGLEWVRQELQRNGYKFSHIDKARNVYRYIRPGSETGIAGVMVFEGKHGDWCTYSHHGGQDPLSHKVCDPFELFAIFQHGGDRKAAARSLMPERPSLKLDRPSRDNNSFNVPSDDRTSSTPGRFQWITRETGLTPVLNGNWLVKHVLPAEGLGVIFGRPGSGKTFSVMDIAMHVAAGIRWRGKKVRAAAVSYVSPEAGRLGVNRVIGWSMHHGIGWPDGFRLSPASINLCSDQTDADALIADVKANQPGCRLVVIDTLNRAMAGGDENSGEDMGRFVALCDHIAKQLAAFVLVVHHSGKDAAKGSRGHSSLLGAVNLELEVTKEQGQPGTIRVSKMRDGEDGAEYAFDLESVPLGVDEDGDEVTTAVSIEADMDEVRAVKEAKPKGQVQKTIADAFAQYVDDYGKPNPAGTGFAEPGRVRVVDEEAFTDFAAGKLVGAEKRKRVRQGILGLVNKGYFVINAGCLWRV